MTDRRSTLPVPPRRRAEESAPADAPTGAPTEETASVPLPPAPPWEEVSETWRERWGRRWLRIAAGAVMALLLLLGLRAIIFPPRLEQPAIRAAASFPTAEAQGVAARYVTSYLTGSGEQGTREQREQELNADAAPGVDVGALDARTTVAAVYPAGVKVVSDSRAVVTVLAQLDVRAKGAKAPHWSWSSLAVPVGWDGRRIVITGSPAFVALPVPGRVQDERPPRPSGDAELTVATAKGVAATFEAMAGDDPAALAQLCAPGAQVAPLGAGLRFDGVQSWRAWRGADPALRTGMAVVRWRLASGAQVSQRYAVTLSAVTAAAQTDWRVAAVTATDSEEQ